MLEAYLHGFLGHPQDWQPLWGALDPGPSACATRTALQLPFHDGPEVASFEGACAALWAQVAAESDDLAHLVGYSLGARLALHMALGAPARTSALTLIGVNPGCPTPASAAARRRADKGWAQVATEQGAAAFFAQWDAQPMFCHRQTTLPTGQAARMQQRSRLSAKDMGAALDVLGLGSMADAWPWLPTLSLPVHLIVGQHDPKFRQLAAAMSLLLPNAWVSVILGAHHDVPMTHPAALAQAMAAFAAVCHGGSGRGSPLGHHV